MLEKFNLSQRKSRLNTKALALLDVLIGIAIFALIAVIAVIAISQFRERAHITTAVSDARNFGTAMEAEATGTGGYPTDVTAAADWSLPTGENPDRGVTLGGIEVGNASKPRSTDRV